jgi:DNA-binding NarL/FixJ family response regulator
LRVLLVEDHDLLAGTLTMALRARGIDAESANGPTPEAVVGRTAALAPVLVLLDLDLGPLGSGRDLVGPLVDAGGRVVIVTGVTDRTQLAACVEAGATGIIAKTVHFDELLEAVERVASGEELLTRHQRDALLADLRIQRRADHARTAPFDALTPREQSVLARLVAGQSAEAIAEASFVSLATVRSQIRSILSKLDVKSQLAAVAAARRAGWPAGSSGPSGPGGIHQS